MFISLLFGFVHASSVVMVVMLNIIKSIFLPEKKRFKLLHFGVLEGKTITGMLESPLKGARAYKTASTIFTPRDEDASLIWVIL